MKTWTMDTILLLAGFLGTHALGQTPSASPSAEGRSDSRADQFQYELHAARLEEIAMCHHAIKAAKHESIAFGQNPYYRYILNAPQKGHTSNVYPIPERCKNLETDWVLKYTNMGPGTKASEEKALHDELDMTASDISNDAQFLTVVLVKMLIEGGDAVYLENMDKDIPKP